MNTTTEILDSTTARPLPNREIKRMDKAAQQMGTSSDVVALFGDVSKMDIERALTSTPQERLNELVSPLPRGREARMRKPLVRNTTIRGLVPQPTS